MTFLDRCELEQLGFRALGNNVLVSDKASIHGAARISIGDNVRIDDFCVLSAGAGGITLGSYIHLGCHTTLIGAGAIELHDYCNVSSRVAIYSSSDDFSGESMTNPMVPPELTNIDRSPVLLEKHCLIGCGSVVLPGTHMEVGVAIGALSLASGHYRELTIYAGVPARALKSRSRRLLDLEQRL